MRSPSACGRCSPPTAGSPPSTGSPAATATGSICCTSRGTAGSPSSLLVWLPGQSTPIHDHVSWCVVGVYRGVEREVHYRLVERDEERLLVPVGEFEARAGHVEALVPPAANIHSVMAAGEGKTISIHVYGADIERLGTSILRRYDDLQQLPLAA